MRRCHSDARHVRLRAQAESSREVAEPYLQAKIMGDSLTDMSAVPGKVLLQLAKNPLQSGLTHPQVRDPVVVCPSLQRQNAVSIDVTLR
jgi:hypothetical protein